MSDRAVRKIIGTVAVFGSSFSFSHTVKPLICGKKVLLRIEEFIVDSL